jgi:hypothetical protein
MPTWDRFAVPRPYGRARAVAGPAMKIPAGLDRDGLEHYRLRVERLLNTLTESAEQWAESGLRADGQCAVYRQGVPWRLRRTAAAREAPAPVTLDDSLSQRAA